MRQRFINSGGKVSPNSGAIIFGFSLWTLDHLVVCGDGVPQYGRLDASDSMDTRGIPGAAMEDYPARIHLKDGRRLSISGARVTM